MEWLLTAVSIITAIFLSLSLLEFIIGFNSIKNLNTQPLLDTFPPVSILLSVLNEEKNLASVIASLANLNYPNYELIVINDRSTDNTAEILKQCHQKFPHIKVHHVKHLPDGWLGKNHALHVAAQKATGDWLLFTDADVTMHRDTLLKALSYVQAQHLDHLIIHEYHPRPSIPFKIALLGYYFCYSIDMKPWRIRYTWSKKSLGRGAFNLISKKSYEQSGGHKAIAMECLDDLKLGKLIKQHGFHQDVVNGQDYVRFEWYTSVKNMIKGLEKNSFAYHNYQPRAALRDVSYAILVFIWPFIASLIFSGILGWINILNVTLIFILMAYTARQYRMDMRFALFFPISMSIMIFTVCNSLFMTYRNKGVIWRGTHYPLDKLRSAEKFE